MPRSAIGRRLRHLARPRGPPTPAAGRCGHGAGISLTRLRAQHGLFTRADLDPWLEANAISSQAARATLSPTRRGSRRSAPSPCRPCTMVRPTSYGCATTLRGWRHARRTSRALLETQGLNEPRVDDACLAPPSVAAPGISSIASGRRSPEISMRPRASLASRAVPISSRLAAGNGYTAAGRKPAIQHDVRRFSPAARQVPIFRN